MQKKALQQVFSVTDLASPMCYLVQRWAGFRLMSPHSAASMAHVLPEHNILGRTVLPTYVTDSNSCPDLGCCYFSGCQVYIASFEWSLKKRHHSANVWLRCSLCNNSILIEGIVKLLLCLVVTICHIWCSVVTISSLHDGGH